MFTVDGYEMENCDFLWKCFGCSALLINASSWFMSGVHLQVKRQRG